MEVVNKPFGIGPDGLVPAAGGRDDAVRTHQFPAVLVKTAKQRRAALNRTRRALCELPSVLVKVLGTENAGTDRFLARPLHPMELLRQARPCYQRLRTFDWCVHRTHADKVL